MSAKKFNLKKINECIIKVKIIKNCTFFKEELHNITVTTKTSIISKIKMRVIE